jgi:hypothetical protein
MHLAASESAFAQRLASNDVAFAQAFEICEHAPASMLENRGE